MSLIKQYMMIQALGLFTILAVAPANAATIYVNDDASGTNDGSSWGDAFTELQSALAIATSGDEIWVAAGTYLPDYDVNTDTHTGDRMASFSLITGVAIYGGFAGDEDQATFNLDDRDYELHETILSGDLTTDDKLASVEEFVARFGSAQRAFNVGNAVINLDVNSRIEKQEIVAFLEAHDYSDNSRHVVISSDTDETAILDGFTISDGIAMEVEGSCPECRHGAGIFGKLGASPTIRHCKVTANITYGTGAGIYDCDGPITDCQITDNISGYADAWSGGGLYGCDGYITDCTIAGNYGGGAGGGLALCNGEITRCTIVGNRVDVEGRGGGMYDCDGSISSCTIAGNYGGLGGGGLYECDGIIKDCIFSENYAELGNGGGLGDCDGVIANCLIQGNFVLLGSGGGMYGCDSIIINCVINNNHVGRFGYSWGGGLSSCNGVIVNCTIALNKSGSKDFIGRSGGLDSCSGSITNCIIWGNIAPIDPQLSGCSTPTYSCIQDWVGGGDGNIDDNPLFMDADGPDDIPGNEDDDLNLQSGSLCIDAGDNTAVSETADLNGNPRIVHEVVDMGAYEYQIVAEVVSLDILPGSDRNPFVPNKKSKGRIPMAILGSEEVAAEDINPDSIKIAGVLSPVKTSTDKDVDGDGLVDLMIHFSRRGLIDALSLDSCEVGVVVDVTVTATRVGDDRPIEATDSIVIVGPED